MLEYTSQTPFEKNKNKKGKGKKMEEIHNEKSSCVCTKCKNELGNLEAVCMSGLECNNIDITKPQEPSKIRTLTCFRFGCTRGTDVNFVGFVKDGKIVFFPEF